MVCFILIQILKKKKLLFANSGLPDQTPRFASSDLVMHSNDPHQVVLEKVHEILEI